MATTKKKQRETKATNAASAAQFREPNAKELKALAVKNGTPIPRAMLHKEQLARGLMTRASIAQLADVESVTVAKWMRQGLLPAELIDGVWYTPRAVAVEFVTRRSKERELLARSSVISRAQLVGLPVTHGQLAAAAFALLRVGKSALDIVEELQMSPEDAVKLSKQWQELRTNSPAPAPQKYTPQNACASCGVNVARFCGPCSDKLIADITPAETTPATRPRPTDTNQEADAT